METLVFQAIFILIESTLLYISLFSTIMMIANLLSIFVFKTTNGFGSAYAKYKILTPILWGLYYFVHNYIICLNVY